MSIDQIESVVRIRFPLTGAIDVPLDHAEALYGALSRICPYVHASAEVRISPVKGMYTTQKRLVLADQGSFYIQATAYSIPHLLRLAGKSIRIGQNRLYIGIPTIHSLTPASNLLARVVVVKGKQTEEEMHSYLRKEISTRFGAILQHEYNLHILRRRVLKLHGKLIYGFGVAITDICDDKLSLQIQAIPIGSRMKYGCSFFMPGEWTRSQRDTDASLHVVDSIEA
ncbi:MULTISPECIES: type I-MYXAN CRISPR-associated protein Cas6/Cmx6 [Brevibacillus]|uniref:Type I-MYXAN CRISPR-associated protein Cas6/Cmx6 n=1 Tax=Brevibacillus invocatus TaxID=173959 RepID=A0A3M8C3H8_9BACL|nr:MULTISPECIES: type I-MYXAN CRISPR-associated protein Cas6/Cmx6 [Brevibacillus]MCM3080619.1 type I-MYXAN CRISPR-associated protein Cas6/Cmx6 [Brevibacillus invocatus]MCM3430764.1 type I-MYXAN CRISPR-associated protein Cas6/Cmx6 [Brevibacillus invocatus]MDH4618960.1 type I-MYXAN CRISPR-associated protein Cas6/Cmx6 [Brevibacillus sp. AY1]RNB69927.1 type I-MYXAN CRISPR-associated protein Cas6/Cmx6 [Brevibacillus invocatus]